MNFYLKKYGFLPPQIQDTIHKNVGIIIVIPCFNESELLGSLNALYACELPSKYVEVITVINAGEHVDESVKQQNLKTYNNAVEWANRVNSDALKFHFIINNNLPKKHAGVGLARKIGMDEAVARFDSIHYDGIIVCFDADSKCDPNYLMEIEQHFKKNEKTPGCSIHYEHPISGEEFDIEIYEGIINYELFLRYYNQALKFCNLPYAFQTVGSSMAVKSSAYQKQGGMNKRKAGEDFYFIHKIISLGHFTNLSTTKVIPSPRISDRVPFGTGKAIGDWIDSKASDYLTYDLKIWLMIKAFVDIIPLLQSKQPKEINFFNESQNTVFYQFLNENLFEDKLMEIKSNSTDEVSFKKRFLVWFNAFKVLKLVHFLRDNQYPNKPIYNEAKLLANKIGSGESAFNCKDLLIAYRIKEKE